MSDVREELIEPADAAPMPEGTTTVGLPADAPAPAPSFDKGSGDSAPSPAPDDVDLVDKLLAEFDQDVAREAPAPAPAAAAPGKTVDFLRYANEMSAATWTRTQNESTINALQGALAQAEQQVASINKWAEDQQHRAAFKEFASGLRDKLPEFLPADHIERWFLAENAKDPNLEQAWRLQHIDPQTANEELSRCWDLLLKLQNDPNANPAQIQQVKAYAGQVEFAAKARHIVRAATDRMLKEARSMRPLDRQAMEDREAVTFAMRGAGAKHIPEKAPDLSRMSDQQLREYTSQFGF